MHPIRVQTAFAHRAFSRLNIMVSSTVFSTRHWRSNAYGGTFWAVAPVDTNDIYCHFFLFTPCPATCRMRGRMALTGGGIHWLQNPRWGGGGSRGLTTTNLGLRSVLYWGSEFGANIYCGSILLWSELSLEVCQGSEFF